MADTDRAGMGFDYKPDRHSRWFVLHITNKRRTDEGPEVQTDFPILWARQSPTISDSGERTKLVILTRTGLYF